MPLKEVRLATGTTLAYRQWGIGKIPVVFVHGYGMSLETWSHVAGKLPPRFRAVACDLRGFGNSEHSGDYRYETHEGDLLALLDSLGMRKAVMVGHSMGGGIVQGFALEHPNRIRALVLTGSSSRLLAPPDPVANRVAERMAGYGDASGNRRVLEARVPQYFHPANTTPRVIERWVKIGLKADTQALKDMLYANNNLKPIPRAKFAALKMPVLVVNGVHESIAGEAHIKSLSDAIPHATIALVGGAGHRPMLERSAVWSETLNAWLDRKVN